AGAARARTTPGDTSGAARARGQDPGTPLPQSLTTYTGLLPGWHGAARRQLLRHHSRPGYLAARDTVGRRHERRGRGARARGDSGARVLLRRARTAGV